MPPKAKSTGGFAKRAAKKKALSKSAGSKADLDQVDAVPGEEELPSNRASDSNHTCSASVHSDDSFKIAARASGPRPEAIEATSAEAGHVSAQLTTEGVAGAEPQATPLDEGSGTTPRDAGADGSPVSSPPKSEGPPTQPAALRIRRKSYGGKTVKGTRSTQQSSEKSAGEKLAEGTPSKVKIKKQVEILLPKANSTLSLDQEGTTARLLKRGQSTDTMAAGISLGPGGDEVPSWVRTLKGPKDRHWEAPKDGEAADDECTENSEAEEMVLPSNSKVMEQLKKENNTGLTFLDVALHIIKDVESRMAGRGDEFRFVRDCLLEGPDRTRLPCGLASNQADIKAVRKSYMVESPQKTSATRGRGSEWRTPLIRGHLRHARNNGMLAVPEETADDAYKAVAQELRKTCPFMGPLVSQWPVDCLDAKTASKLEGILHQEFNSWGFDIFNFAKITSGRPLLFIGWEVLGRGSCFVEFALDPERAKVFLQEIEGMYRTLDETPYHNNYHAADVTQSVHSLMVDLGVGKFFDPMDVLGVVLAAAIHDVGHDGRNNAFHANKQDELALTYNDKSILENYHVSQGFSLLANKPKANLLHALPHEQFRILRKEVISMVLGTDMSLHFTHVGDFQNYTEKLGSDPAAWHAEDKAVDLLRGMVLHAADLANPSKTLHVSQEWSQRLLREFFLQGDEEKQMGLPVSPMCDRDTVNVPGSQIGFINFVVSPTFLAVGGLFPLVEDVVSQSLSRTKRFWEHRQKAKIDNE